MSLCDRCRNGLIFERANGRVTYICHAAGDDRSVPGDIVRCSDFSARTSPELWELRELGWRLEKDKNGRVKGFQPPKEDAL